MAIPNRAKPLETDFDHLLAEAFRRPCWRVHRAPPKGAVGPDLIVEGDGKKYLIEFKRSSEGRSDRLIPLLSQAILQAQAYVRLLPEAAVPVAVVGAERIPHSVAENLKQFAFRVAPETAVGVIDREGFRAFAGHGLEVLNANPSRSARPHGAAHQRLPHLFSDLNQWMLKILLSRLIPEDLLSAPREEFRNASQLARAANVSVMSAFRFVRQLANEGFLEQREGYFEMVRIHELLRRWIVTDRQSEREIPVRWIIKKDRQQLNAALKAHAIELSSVSELKSKARTGRKANRPPRACLGLFAAADALGLGFVHGLPPYIYLERYDVDVLRRLGLSAQDAEHSPDAYIRVPDGIEALFRPAVMRDGVPVSDIVQVWLDVSRHPSRGQAQADEIRRRVLGPLFAKK
jgi:hypothetical protein